MDRGSFLTSLAGAATALGLVKPSSASASQAIVSDAVLEQVAHDSLNQITLEVARHLRHLYPARVDKALALIGDTSDRLVARHQFSVHATLNDRYMRPAPREIAESLAAACRREGIQVFGVLAVPRSGALEGHSVQSDESAVRGLVQYDLPSDRTMLRFDVLAG